MIWKCYLNVIFSPFIGNDVVNFNGFIFSINFGEDCITAMSKAELLSALNIRCPGKTIFFHEMTMLSGLP